MDLLTFRSGPLGASRDGVRRGWTPGMGPVLAGILTAAPATQAAWTGAGLLLAYFLGLGIPFVLSAVGYAKGASLLGWLRRHGRGVERIGGTLLVSMGVLMTTGRWLRLFTPLIRWFSKTGGPDLRDFIPVP